MILVGRIKLFFVTRTFDEVAILQGEFRCWSEVRLERLNVEMMTLFSLSTTELGDAK